MELFCIAGDGQNHGNCNMMFNVDHRSVVADLCQTAGHMLGRIVRLTLKIHEDGSAPYDDLLSYLVEDDLAQRRLLHVVDGI
jgi:hypothetical protein